jgi:hypothetical protein
MSNFPVPRPYGRIARTQVQQHAYELAEVEHDIDMRSALMAGVGLLGKQAMLQQGEVSLIAQAASMLAPGDELLQAVIKVATTTEMANVISGSGHPGRRR